MKIDRTNKAEFFSALYESARCASAAAQDELALYMEQYRGSDRIDGSNERACAVRNITYELIESQVSSELPAPHVEPMRYSERHSRNARSIEWLCTRIRDELPFERLNDIDERYSTIYGGSIWLAEWDDSLQSYGERGGVRVSCISPRDFIGQPNIPEIEDMEYCFLRFVTTRDELPRRYGISEALAEAAETDCTRGEDRELTREDDTVTVIVCFYRDEEGEIGRYAWSGGAQLCDQPRYYHRRRRVCRRCGRPHDACMCEHPQIETEEVNAERLTHDIRLSDGSVIGAWSPAVDDGGYVLGARGYCPPDAPECARMEQTELPYFVPRCFPVVVRRNTAAEGKLLGQSDCCYIRPLQQAINKVESRIMQKLMRSGVTPILPEDAQIQPDNSIFGQVIRLRPGESAAQYGIIDTTPQITQDIAQAQRLYEQAKRIIGVTDSYQGMEESSNQSGVAKQVQVQQSAGRLESKRRMKNATYAALDRLFFEFYLAYADEPRAVTYKDIYGNTHNESFSRYDFIEYDEESGRYLYDDGYLFSADRSGGIEQQREELWRRNLENLTAGTLGDPSSPRTLLRYWQSQERAHYPYAHENVEYFRDLLRTGQRRQEGEEKIDRSEFKENHPAGIH